MSSRAFREHLHPDAIAAFVGADDAALGAALDALARTAEAAWPALAVTPERFAAELARRLGDAATPAVLGGLHHDVWLAVACADGDARATALVDATIALECEAAARRLGARDTLRDELAAEVRRIALVDDPPRAAAIRGFTGRGDLRGYLRIVAARALVRILERDRRETPTDDDTLADLRPHLATALAPEIALLRERHRDALDAALRDAIAALAARPRALLRYHLVDGWTVDKIGERYGVHRSTAARWVADARAEVGTAIRNALADGLAVPRSQIDSLVVMLMSGIDISLERLL